METTVVAFLDGLSSTVFRLAAIAFVVLNGAVAAAVVVTRSRRLVDTWIPKLLTADAVLVAAGLGVPVVAGIAKFGVKAVAALTTGGAPLPE